MSPPAVRNETLTTAWVTAGLNRASVKALPGVVAPPAKAHRLEIWDAHGAVLHPPDPATTWLTLTPPPAKANEVALLPAGRPSAGLTAAEPSAGTTTVRWVAATTPLPVGGPTEDITPLTALEVVLVR